MSTSIQLLDVVALTHDLPERGPRRSQVGTPVEGRAPGVFEVGFADGRGRKYLSLAVPADQLRVHRYQSAQLP
jgi:hypothetical protein